MQRLSTNTLSQLGAAVSLPAFDRAALKTGIVHFGVGNFHRAHQAVYTDEAIKRCGGHWGIVGVSLRSATSALQLNPQDGLYSVCVESAQGREQRIIGALQRVLFAPEQAAELDALLADPAISVVTLTITEKGYCLADDGWSLDLTLPEVASDLKNPDAATTAIGLLARGLAKRYQNGAAPLTIISCDNLTENSRRLRACLTAYLHRSWPEVLPWMEQSLSFPCSMVDRIVPAVTERALNEQAASLGLRDEAAVLTEPFCQWVIEDDFAAHIPGWQQAGAMLVPDIKPFESAKLRLLNAAHSAIAYIGLLAEAETVADVMQDPPLADYVGRLMTTELIPAIAPPPGLDLTQYGEQLLQRFANPCLHHRCAQIAIDGTEKIPLRWHETLSVAPEKDLLTRGLACWCYFILDTDLPIDDPRKADLEAQRNNHEGLEKRIGRLLEVLRLTNVDSKSDNTRQQLLVQHYQQLAKAGVRSVLAS